ncbi:probable methylthioribulose-1-phosphate dehydratase [Hyposmocoma kahamanoa]|uniref:probable methylthioribulose-1-phosphate dehydratase n=1 Tax=Hyposmocoma kahamanoa TaxID=1477025 RepID=UPI000E6D9EAC|nr:probable methylthioribulose-1-phosphate dehydratase [Hyposmocoma kahamanoa]XP_026318914.1 probable methylthioribulose-1-phosphate dehydratase [Hyposmocoma kahamanoa]
MVFQNTVQRRSMVSILHRSIVVVTPLGDTAPICILYRFFFFILTRLKKSQCTPLFLIAYRERNAGAVIHTHSPHAVRCTLLYDKEFRITHQEMIKGIKDAKLGRYLRYDEELVVPIIENTPFEKDLACSMAEAIQKYPGTSAVLVRRHGVYVWGDTWQQAKTMTECYDYLFEMAVEMKKLGLDPTFNPENGANGKS